MRRSVIQSNHGWRIAVSQGAPPQPDEKTPRKPPAVENQWLVPRVVRLFWRRRRSVEVIANLENLPRLAVQNILRENSVPILDGPAQARRAA